MFLLTEGNAVCLLVAFLLGALNRRFERPILWRCWETNKGEGFVIMNVLLVSSTYFSNVKKNQRQTKNIFA